MSHKLQLFHIWKMFGETFHGEVGEREISSKRHQLSNWKINMETLPITVWNLPGIMSYGVLDVYYKAEVRVPYSLPAMAYPCPTSLLKGWMLKLKAKHNKYPSFHHGYKDVTVQESLCVPCNLAQVGVSTWILIAKCGKGWRSGQWEWRQGEGFRITLDQSNGLNTASWSCTWWT